MEATTTRTITATLVTGNAKLAVLPRYLKHKYLMAESTVFAIMRSICRQYRGGDWNYYELSNGGFYMAPKTDMTFSVSGTGIPFEKEVSADAAGIITCMLVWGRIACDTEDDHFIQLHRDLEDYAYQHPEASLIRKALD